ncbi:MAG: penicillin-binding transpeptidase domain-containing protein [Candidatus Paceibacterota bacterium]|jgi:penicillin-binding protein 2
MRIFKKKRKIFEIAPDEIFLDSKNIPQFNTQQMEGKIEKPISKKTTAFLWLFFLIVISIFTWKISALQLVKGEYYFKKSQDNSLNRKIIFADRGIIYDRNNVRLAWNSEIMGDTGDISEKFLLRSYIKSPGLSHVLGYVSYPKKDKSGNYWREVFTGKDGVEKKYDNILKGENGEKLLEKDALNTIQSESVVNPSKNGDNVVLSIDSGVQTKLFEAIKSLAGSSSYVGGGGVLMDINNGEILAITSYPEYDSEIMSLGSDSNTIGDYQKSSRKPFLNRALNVYAPGSIVKPFIAMGALNEQVIDPLKKILSTGSISIPNPYFPDKPSIFKDWKAHGWVDMRRALAVSSDVYFYEVGGGYKDQKGLGIVNIDKYMKMFMVGEKTGVDLYGENEGVIPTPEWKELNFNGDPWRVGDTYHTSIGQYGFQVSPIQMVRAISAIANDGTLVSPHVVLGDKNFENKTEKIELNTSYFDIVKEGMRGVVMPGGTATMLDVPYVKVAAKTGSAQVGISKKNMHAWVIGFFPYEKPRYAFAVLMESGPSQGASGAQYVMRQVLDWMSINAPEYFK